MHRNYSILTLLRKDSSIREGIRGLGFGLEVLQALLREGEVVVCDLAKGA
jgi:hypothetical protein